MSNDGDHQGDPQQLFNHLISELKRGNRPRLKLTRDQLDRYGQLWQDYHHQFKRDGDEHQLKKNLIPLLGILDHAINSSQELADLFVTSLTEVRDSELLVYLLSGASKHVIEEKQKRGERADHTFLQALETTLKHPSPEVLEWSLRCIEQLGSQSIFFKQHVLARRPSFFARFNKHNKAAGQLIDYLEKRWSPPR